MFDRVFSAGPLICRTESLLAFLLTLLIAGVSDRIQSFQRRGRLSRCVDSWNSLFPPMIPPTSLVQSTDRVPQPLVQSSHRTC